MVVEVIRTATDDKRKGLSRVILLKRIRSVHHAQNPAFSIEATKIFGSGVVNGPKGLFGS